MGEQIADGTASPDIIESANALSLSLAYVGGIADRGLSDVNPFVVGAAKSALAKYAESAARGADFHLCEYAYEMKVDNLPPSSIWLRDIFGNPCRPVDFAPWRTDTAVPLARQMYDLRDFGAMPILADALQDAGCNDATVLTHCRGDGPHVRGCWVVDGVLGLE